MRVVTVEMLGRERPTHGGGRCQTDTVAQTLGVRGSWGQRPCWGQSRKEGCDGQRGRAIGRNTAEIKRQRNRHRVVETEANRCQEGEKTVSLKLTWSSLPPGVESLRPCTAQCGSHWPHEA